MVVTIPLRSLALRVCRSDRVSYRIFGYSVPWWHACGAGAGAVVAPSRSASCAMMLTPVVDAALHGVVVVGMCHNLLRVCFDDITHRGCTRYKIVTQVRTS